MDALGQFHDSLAEIRKIADHGDALLAERSADTALVNAIARSGLVLLCGYFEGFIRELAQEAADLINENEVDVNLLPRSLLASVVETAFKLSGEKRANALSLIRERIKLGAPCALDRNRLSSTGGNPSVDVIEGLMGSFGIDSIIDTLSVRDFGVESTYTVEHQSKAIEGAIIEALGSEGHGSLEKVLGVVDSKWLPKKRRRSVGYVSAIEELLKRRNRIAHGEGREIVTPPELREHASVLEKLAEGLAEAMEALVNGLAPAPASEAS